MYIPMSISKRISNVEQMKDKYHEIKDRCNKNNHINFRKFVIEIAGKGPRVKYVKSGKIDHIFKLITDNGEFGIKMVPYRRYGYGDIGNEKRPENVEIKIINILVDFVITRKTPHIILPILSFRTDIRPFIRLIKDKVIPKTAARYKNFVKQYKEGWYCNTASILVSEWVTGDLRDLLEKKSLTTKEWIGIFFQLLSVLALIQDMYKNFRHNDLHLGNILVRKADAKIKEHEYKMFRKLYIVKNIGYHVHLWDYDSSAIHGIVDNIKVDKVWTDEFNVRPKKNHYYDIHFFFCRLMHHIRILGIKVPKKIKQFIDRVVPKKYAPGSSLVERSYRILVDDEYTTPQELIENDPLFRTYRRGNKSGRLKLVQKVMKDDIWIRVESIEEEIHDVVKSMIDNVIQRIINEKIDP